MTELQAAVARVAASPCECVRCDDCGGTGRIAYRAGFTWDDDYETCDGCQGGVSEICDRCRELQDMEEA